MHAIFAVRYGPMLGDCIPVYAADLRSDVVPDKAIHVRGMLSYPGAAECIGLDRIEELVDCVYSRRKLHKIKSASES